MKVDWLDDAAEAIIAAKGLPRFPGEPSPVRELLDKLVSKLWGECHDGEELGTGQCAPCRAYRTEKAEKQAENAIVEEAEQAEKVAKLEVELARVLDTVQEMYEVGVEQEKAIEALTAALERAEVKQQAAQAEAVQAVSERGFVEKHLDAATKELVETKEHLFITQTKLARLTAIAEEMLK